MSAPGALHGVSAPGALHGGCARALGLAFEMLPRPCRGAPAEISRTQASGVAPKLMKPYDVSPKLIKPYELQASTLKSPLYSII